MPNTKPLVWRFFFTALLAVVMVATVSAAVEAPSGDSPNRPKLAVDPNTLSCDPLGQIFLLLPSFTDCNKYYVCDNGKEVEMSCPAGLIFDYKQQVCNWDWAATCILRTPEPEGSGDYDEGTDEWAAEQQDDSDPESLVGALKVEGSAHFKVPLDCKRPGSAEKRIANKDDCQRYWRCVNGEISSFFCTDGLFFNDKSQQCDFEANVICNVNHEHELQGEFMVYKS